MSLEKCNINTLRVGQFLISTGVNGPGKRFVIWVQGCTLGCRGCCNPEFWDNDEGQELEVYEIIQKIRMAEGIEGVTFTGGEPLQQAGGLLPIAKWARSANLSVVCYSGYLFQEIFDGKIQYAKELLSYVDILIDGRYMEEQKAPLLWRGSKNQKIYFLTGRYTYLEPLLLKEGSREVELQVGKDGLVMTGIFDLRLWKKLKGELEKAK